MASSTVAMVADCLTDYATRDGELGTDDPGRCIKEAHQSGDAPV